MAYIGKEPTTGNFIYADDITTSATNTYNILVGGVAFSPESANHLIVSLNGVIQKANTSFSVSGSQITFIPSSGTLSSSDSIDFILILGSVNDVGVATTVSDSAITKNKLNLISTSGSPGLEVKGDGSSENGTIQLNCSQNSHGVKISSPAHSAGQSYELILPTGNVTADKFLKVASVSGSGATGIGQLSFADAGGNAPAFEAYLSSAQTVSNDTLTVVSADTEVFDSDSAYNTSNYRFTPQTAGKYFVYGIVYLQSGQANNFYYGWSYIRKNGGSNYVAQQILDTRDNGNGRAFSAVTHAIVDMNGSSDYLDLTGYHNAAITSSGVQFDAGLSKTKFGAFKLGGV
jgi:hypothetical protein